MNSLIARYSRAPRYAWSAAIAVAGAFFSAWMGLHWTLCFVAAALFAVTAVAVTILAARPEVEIFDQHLAIGTWTVPWTQIREVDYSGWLVPLMIRLTLEGGERKLLLFPGDKESGTALLRLIRRMSYVAQLDGLTYQEFWSDAPKPASSFSSDKTRPRRNSDRTAQGAGNSSRDASNKSSSSNKANNAASDTGSAAAHAAPTRYPMLRPEDEREVEQMFQRLKSVGHLESRDSQE